MNGFDSSSMAGFDYATYLKRHLMVGQIDPWRKTDEGKPFYALLVPVDTAIHECQGWSGQDFGRKEFISYLKTNDILVLSTPEDLSKVREDKVEEVKVVKAEKKAKRVKREVTPERREQLRIQALKMREVRKASTCENPL